MCIVTSAISVALLALVVTFVVQAVASERQRQKTRERTMRLDFMQNATSKDVGQQFTEACRIHWTNHVGSSLLRIDQVFKSKHGFLREWALGCVDWLAGACKHRVYLVDAYLARDVSAGGSHRTIRSRGSRVAAALVGGPDLPCRVMCGSTALVERDLDAHRRRSAHPLSWFVAVYSHVPRCLEVLQGHQQAEVGIGYSKSTYGDRVPAPASARLPRI
jgi:hypothetical protein